MTERIGRSLLAREALLAAMEARQRETAQSRETGAGGFTQALGGLTPGQGAEEPKGADAATRIVEALGDGMRQVDDTVHRTEALDEALVTGKVKDFHEVAVQLKQADLSFRFALEVRNRLVDAYREVMRMNV